RNIDSPELLIFAATIVGRVTWTGGATGRAAATLQRTNQSLARGARRYLLLWFRFRRLLWRFRRMLCHGLSPLSSGSPSQQFLQCDRQVAHAAPRGMEY